ncbi:MAG: T9SS type A sorting domain-containing protein [Planctomycetes bacterium]|nr:T9SS type A sorting domain-containing protein [Planctomycetota bacterium]
MMTKRLILTTFFLFFIVGAIGAQDSWQFMNGPYYAEVTDLVINPQNGDELYASTATHIYKTTNAAAWWFSISDDLPRMRYTDLAIMPGNPDFVYAGSDSGLFRTTDAGLTWQPLSQTGPIFDIAFDPNDNQTLYVGTHGIFKSTDAGLTWLDINGDMPLNPETNAYPEIQAIAVDYMDPNILYLGREDLPAPYFPNIFKSTNGGQSWLGIDGTLFSGFNDMFIDPTNPNVLYTGVMMTGAYKSTNAGEWWYSLANPSVLALALHPDDPSIVYCAMYIEEPFHLCVNEGPWLNGMSEGLVPPLAWYINAIVFHPDNPDIMYLATREGVYVSFGDYHWQPRNQGFVNPARFVSIGVQDEQRVIYTGGGMKRPNVGSGGIGYGTVSKTGLNKSVDNGQNWTYSGLMNVFNIYVNPYNIDQLFVFDGGPNQGGYMVVISTNGGVDWFTPVENLWGGSNLNSEFVFDPNNPDVSYFAKRFALFKSEDNWESWIEYWDPFYDDKHIWRLTIQPQDSNIMYAATIDGIYKSSDGGPSWEYSGLEGMHIRGIDLSPLDPNLVFAINYHGGAYRSTDAGQSWILLENGLPDGILHDIELHPDNQQLIYIQTADQGVYHSSDGGESWQPMNEGLTTLDMGWDLVIDPLDHSRLYATTNQGLFMRQLPLSVEDDVSTGQLEWSVAQNYPNPFNPSTTIRYQLPATGHVSLRVYNTAGQLVRTLVDRQEDTGYQSIVWDGQNDQGEHVTSGLYFYRLEAGEYQQTRSMLLLK